MKTNAQLWSICLEIYRKMYKEAEPKADFDKLRRSKITSKPQWFMKYYLSMEKQDNIIAKILKKHKVDESGRRKVRQEIMMGCSPNSCKKTFKENKKLIE